MESSPPSKRLKQQKQRQQQSKPTTTTKSNETRSIGTNRSSSSSSTSSNTTQAKLQSTPRTIRPFDYAQARSAELKMLLDAIRTTGGNKRIFQKLPRHLRRRTMSHNINRIPRRLREAAKREVRCATAWICSFLMMISFQFL
jgi:ribonuclease P/MRP protein subunit POP1